MCIENNSNSTYTQCYTQERIDFSRKNEVFLDYDPILLFEFKGVMDFVRWFENSEWCPLQESNLQLALRRGSLYPFN